MPALDIPYTPRIPVEDDRVFKNYGREIEEMKSGLQRPGSAYALVGGPGMAKSSILKRVERDLLQDSTSDSKPVLVPVYLQLVPPGTGDSNKLRILLRNLMSDVLRDVRRIVPDLEFEDASLRIDRNPRRQTSEEQEDLIDFTHDLWELIKELEAKAGPVKLVLLIDEVARLHSDRPLRVSFARFLLDLIGPGGTNRGKTVRQHLAFVLACSRDLPELLPTDDGRALGGFVTPKYLCTLDSVDSFELIRGPLQEWAGVELSREVVREIHWQTGGHPCLIHSIMKELCIHADLQSITTGLVQEKALCIADGLSDIADAILAYIRESPLAKPLFASIYQRGGPLPLEQVLKSLPDEYKMSFHHEIETALKVLGFLGAVRIVRKDGLKMYTDTGEIFRRWFALAGHALPRRPQVEMERLFPTILTGVNSPDISVIEYSIHNPCLTSQTVRFMLEIDGFSTVWHQEVVLASEESKNLPLSVVFTPEEINRIETAREAVLHTRISFVDESGVANEASIQDYKIALFPRDVWLLARVDGNGRVDDLTHHIAAWVTPNSPPVEEMLRNAAEFNPLGKGIWGYQGASTTEEQQEIVHAQIEAMYNALRENGQTYVEASLSFGQKPTDVQQRVRLPRKTLELKSANCIDGSVLFASLIEKCGMNPVIVIVPGHAFVGWETWENSEAYEFLETTMIRECEFSQALAEGDRQYKESLENGDLKRELFDPQGFARLLRIKDIHRAGIMPMEAA